MLDEIIATNLKHYRSERCWSLGQAALETSVSKAMLGQIERRESSPTIATLWKIAKGFKLPLTAFIEPQCAVDHSLLGKQIAFDNALRFKVLFSFDPLLCSEMFAHQLAPGVEHLSNAHQQGVIEDIIVISGELEIFDQGGWHPLKSGETLRFNADQPHGYRNLSAKETIFHNIIHYPKKSYQ